MLVLFTNEFQLAATTSSVSYLLNCGHFIVVVAGEGGGSSLGFFSDPSFPQIQNN